MTAPDLLSAVALILVILPVVYLYSIALASLRVPRGVGAREPTTRFAIAIPAHDEEAVMERTVAALHLMDYPERMYTVHVVADHCTDDTAAVARAAGATVQVRDDGPRSGKGAALQWLFARILAPAPRLRDITKTVVTASPHGSSGEEDSAAAQPDAVVVFDADTRVSPDFLRHMDARLVRGAQVVQGQHRISNAESGWFPSLTAAMFLVENRLGNQGRANLGWSAKNMGDSICFRADILRHVGWGDGLTEDYQLRQILLLQGIRIGYERAAVGQGEAPLSWAQARAQRARWLRGTRDASRQYARPLLVAGLRRRDAAMIDGALQASLPSYSSVTLAAVIALALQLAANAVNARPLFSTPVLLAWCAVAVTLLCYPLIGLFLEHAPPRAYLAILSGPVFIVWRTWVALAARAGLRPPVWVRTAHGRDTGHPT
jgi:cellulose synthase/poly-beta-1,6-N-acetylglucosamine synthase-like glycosyltransferase